MAMIIGAITQIADTMSGMMNSTMDWDMNKTYLALEAAQTELMNNANQAMQSQVTEEYNALAASARTPDQLTNAARRANIQSNMAKEGETANTNTLKNTLTDAKMDIADAKYIMSMSGSVGGLIGNAAALGYYFLSKDMPEGSYISSVDNPEYDKVSIAGRRNSVFSGTGEYNRLESSFGSESCCTDNTRVGDDLDSVFDNIWSGRSTPSSVSSMDPRVDFNPFTTDNRGYYRIAFGSDIESNPSIGGGSIDDNPNRNPFTGNSTNIRTVKRKQLGTYDVQAAQEASNSEPELYNRYTTIEEQEEEGDYHNPGEDAF